MDLETQEYIRNIFKNWAQIQQNEIKENIAQGRPYVQEIERIVTNMESAIYIADCKVRERRDELNKLLFPPDEDSSKWQ